MAQRNQKQIRAIKRYAKKIHQDFDTAFYRWCDSGLAAQWAQQN